jgi:lysyl-tRNA synthetase class 2
MPTIRSSSVIAWVEYRKPARILEVGFKQGRRYSYYGVPEAEYQGLLDSPSKGAYYNTRIRDHYPYWRRPEHDVPMIKRGSRRRRST